MRRSLPQALCPWVSLLACVTVAGAPALCAEEPSTRPATAPKIVATVSLIPSAFLLDAGRLAPQTVQLGADGVIVMRVRPEETERLARTAPASSQTADRDRVLSTLYSKIPVYGALFDATSTVRGPLAVRAVSGEMKAGEESVFELNWPDDRPRYYLEDSGGGTYRRVELADKEGYSVALRVTEVAAESTVLVAMTRKVLAGGRRDDSIGAVVGRPTLVKTVCTTSVPVSASLATVVLWQAPAAVGSDAIQRLFWTPSATDRPGLAVVLRVGELPSSTKAAPRTGQARPAAPTPPATPVPAPAASPLAVVPPAPVEAQEPTVGTQLEQFMAPAAPPTSPAPATGAAAVEEAATPGGPGGLAQGVEKPGVIAQTVLPGAVVGAGSAGEAGGKRAGGITRPGGGRSGGGTYGAGGSGGRGGGMGSGHGYGYSAAGASGMVRVEVVIAVDLGLAELPVGSPAWVQLHTAADAHQTLPQLMGEGKIAVLATPTVLVPDGFTAEVMVGAQAPPAAGGGAGAPGMGAAAGGPEAPAAGAGAVAHPEAFLQRRVWVTPRLQDDGKIMLTVELRFDELLGKVDANTEDISPVGTRSGTVRLLAVPGRPVLVSGLVRLGGAKGFVRLQEAGDKGAGALELVESFLVLTPRIVQDNRAQKPKTAY